MSPDPSLPERPPPRKSSDVSKSSLWISAVFHGVIILVLFFVAARQGILGENLRKISVEMVREKPVEKPKEPEKPKPAVVEEKPKALEAPVRQESRPPVQATTVPPPDNTVPPPVSAAPAPVQIAAFEFDGGRPIQTSGDPIQVYKGLLESYLRANWKRPEDSKYDNFATEVEVSVSALGEIAQLKWQSPSHDERWDESIRGAFRSSPALPTPPPSGFPPRVTIRFDVVDEISIP